MTVAKTRSGRKRVRLKDATPPLNDQQQAIADYIRDKDGSLIVVARAGCGKTYTLLNGIIRTVVEEALGSVALMAFNKAISLEFKDRLEKMGGKYTDYRIVDAGTVHSFGFRAWRQLAERVKLDDKKVYSLIQNKADMHQTFSKNIWRDCGSAVRKSVSLAKQAAFGVDKNIDDIAAWRELLEHHAVNDLTENFTLDEVIEAAINIYRQSLDRCHDVIDFDDMILAPLIYNAPFYPKDFVLIDEAQDINAARRILAQRMMPAKGGRMVAVGDDKQAIYGFTGADSDALNIIKELTNAAELPLTITYRCPKLVVAEANKLVPDLQAHESAPEGIVRRMDYSTEVDVDKDNPEKGKKTVLWFETETPDVTAAVLCRNTKPLIGCAYSMLRSGLGCRVEGRDIGEGLITLAHKWKSVKTIGALIDKLESYKAKEIEKWTQKGKEERIQAIEDKCDTLILICEKLSGEGKQELYDLDDFIRGLFGDTKPGEIPKVVTLATIHRSKGREWDTVYFLFKDTTLPSPYAKKPWQLAQEINLEYVADTRSKNELVFIN